MISLINCFVKKKKTHPCPRCGIGVYEQIQTKVHSIPLSKMDAIIVSFRTRHVYFG